MHKNDPVWEYGFYEPPLDSIPKGKIMLREAMEVRIKTLYLFFLHDLVIFVNKYVVSVTERNARSEYRRRFNNGFKDERGEKRRRGGGREGKGVKAFTCFRKRWLIWIKTWEQLESEEREQKICMNISDLSREEKNRRYEIQKSV